MSEQFYRSKNQTPTDTVMLKNFVKRMHRKLVIKQAFYRDGDRHRFSNNNLTLPVDFSL